MTVEEQLAAMTLAARTRARELREMADKRKLDVHSKMHLIIDDLHRKFVYRPDPVAHEYVRLLDLDRGGTMDVDDACTTVVAIAASIGIKCRLVLASYKHDCWTMRVAYEADGAWTVVDVLRQPWTNELRFEQLIIGPEVE